MTHQGLKDEILVGGPDASEGLKIAHLAVGQGDGRLKIEIDAPPLDRLADGVAHLAFISSAAETGTRIESKPLVDSAFSRSPPVTWHPRAVDHLFVERSKWLHGC